MEIHFSYLELLPQVVENQRKLEELLSNHIDKRWLNTRELSAYLGYSKESIDKKVLNGEFILDIHYYKTSAKRLFDKEEIDNWIRGIPSSKTPSNAIVEEILYDIKK